MLANKSNHKMPSWPKERDLSTYSKYAAIDFEKVLSSGKIWIDVGCRTGKALSQTRKLYKAQLVGINTHAIKVRSGVQSIQAHIPEDISVYKKYQKKADLVTDVYGAVSYCENPLNALIYEACLLTSEATAVIVTLEERFEGATTLRCIQQFFKKIMKQSIGFERFITYSDNTKTPIKTLRISIKGMYQSEMILNDLFFEAQKYVGSMKKIKVVAEPSDKSFTIWQVRYSKNRFRN